jgi:hypothetical protein
MGVLMQAFYWDCPKVTNQQFNWWNFVINEIPRLKTAGITAIWLPPACKAKDVMSMGYNPFDYYDFGLAQSGYESGIDALISVHEKYAAGISDVIFADDDLYILQRRGLNDLNGLIYVLNMTDGVWNGKNIQTQWKNTKFTPQAWRGTYDLTIPQTTYTDNNCYGAFWAAPRGYAVYVPE